MDDSDETAFQFVPAKEEPDPKWQLNECRKRQIYTALIVNLLSISNGFSAGWTSPVFLIFGERDNPLGEEPVSHDTFTWISSALYIGGLCGVPIWNDFADRFGRKMAGYVLALTQITSWLGIIFARNVTFVIAARVLMGLGGSGIMVHNQLFINETTRGRMKNTLSCFMIIFVNLGLLLVNTGGYFLSYEFNNYVCLSVPFIFIFMFYWLPETPLYFMSKDKIAKARESLLWYRGGMENATNIDLIELHESIQNTGFRNVPYKELWATRDNLRATIIAVILFMGQQLSGYSAVLAYTTLLFQLTITSMPPLVPVIIVLFSLFVISCVSSYIVNLFSKKNLIFGSYLTAFWSFLFFYSFFIVRNQFQIGLTFFSITSLMIFLISYNIGIGTVPYSLCLNMFPDYVLNNGLTVATMIGVFTAFVTVKITPPPGEDSHVALIWASMNLIMAIFVFFIVEESQEEIVEEKQKEINYSIN